MSKKLTTQEFIERAKKVHGDKYDYSKTDLNNRDEKGRVCIICLEHGEFWQLPSNHLNGQKCRKCKYEIMSKKFSMKTHDFINKSMEIHGDKYDYSKTDLEHRDKKGRICIICPIHGEFWQRPVYHLMGGGCKKCGIISGHKKQSYTKDEFIEKATKIHDGKYDYSKVKYIDSNTKVCIICPTHGEFLQRPADHLQGIGCEKCKESNLEKTTAKELDKNGYKYLRQKRFEWLGRQSLDFYLPKYNIAIECQGEQHFKPINYFNGQKGYKLTIERDKKKKQLCEEHDIKLYYINYDEEVETKLNEILAEKCQNI